MEKNKLAFAAINPVLTNFTPDLLEQKDGGKDIIKWGSDNRAPQYLYELYSSVPTLNAIINTCVNYTIGNGVEKSPLEWMDTIDFNDMLNELAKSYFIYGGFALNVRRNKLKQIHTLEAIDFKNVRSNNKKHELLYYSGDLSKNSYSRVKYQVYSNFNDTVNDKPDNSIFYYSNDKFKIYPTPIYNAAITACEIEKSIDSFHLNNINNGFVGSVVFSFNDGIPDEEQQVEIERNINEKFAGKENAGRILISYANDKDHALEITQLQADDFSDKYNSLAERSEKEIYSAFRITPTLLGITTNNLGFAREQYNDQFELFYNTVIVPVKNKIIQAIKTITGETIEIPKPKIDFEG